MTDKELLELAAKAAGIDGRYASLDEFPDWMTCHDGEGIYFTGSQAWNPLTDDGDALRLAVKLNIVVWEYGQYDRAMAEVRYGAARGEYWELGDDPYAATRRAIVRAAAELARQTSNGKTL